MNRAGKPNLAVGVLFYEKVEQTIECIRSFLPSAVTIYVLNNGSSASSRQELGKFCNSYKQVTIFDPGSNLGVSVGRNYLISHTKEQWLLFVDNDIIMKTQDWLPRAEKYLASNSDIEVFIPRLFDAQEKVHVSPGSFELTGNKANLNYEVTGDLRNTFPGGASLVNRKVFGRLGPYDDQMFVGFEDFELCLRAICAGNPVKALIVHDIELVHDHRRVKTSEDKKAIQVRYSLDLHQLSFNRIKEKHNLELDTRWRPWVADQIKSTMTRPEMIKLTIVHPGPILNRAVGYLAVTFLGKRVTNRLVKWKSKFRKA